MATQTTNYSLVKPAVSEFYDIDVQNGNMDIIDAQMKAQADNTTFTKLTVGNRLDGSTVGVNSSSTR